MLRNQEGICKNFITGLIKENNNQRTNGPVNAHLISGPAVSTKTSFANLDIVLKWVKVNSRSSFKAFSFLHAVKTDI